MRTGQQGFAQVKMCSGEIRFITVKALATVGVVSNPFHKLEILGTAGANRRRGKRPRVRGVAMNPVDHPMGGRGRRRGMPSTSPWGKITKGVFTVKKHLQKYVIKARPTRNMRKKQSIRRTGKYAVQNDMNLYSETETPVHQEETVKSSSL
jgi:large subunit ribosomal protein L2